MFDNSTLINMIDPSNVNVSIEHPCSSGTAVQEDASSVEECTGPPVAIRWAVATSD